MGDTAIALVRWNEWWKLALRSGNDNQVTTDVDNIASRRVIEANGGQIVERFRKPAAYGGAESPRFRIFLG